MLTARTVVEQWPETVDFYEEIHPAHRRKPMTRGFWNPPRYCVPTLPKREGGRVVDTGFR